MVRLLKTSLAARALGGGRIAAPAGGIVLFATKPGTTASDGAPGENGLFSKYLLHALKLPLTLHEAFMQVVRAVSEASGDRQRPQTLYDLTVNFSFFDIAREMSHKVDGNGVPESKSAI